MECSSTSRPRSTAASVDLDRDDVEPVPGEDLDDARTHGAESDDANPGEVPSRSVDHVGKGGSRGYRWVGMADATVVTLVPAVDWTRRAGFGRAWGTCPEPVCAHRESSANDAASTVLTQQGWAQDPGPDEGGGLAGVREPRRPSPSRRPMAALPLPEDENAR